MSKVIAVLGAGTGLGESVARRFGREGFRVALVARRRERLDALRDRLAADGIDAESFTADLSRPADVPALIADIRDRFGRIDVIEYGPFDPGSGLVPAVDVTADVLRDGLATFVQTPVEVVRAVLPEWTERGDGAFLLTNGVSAVDPMPRLSGIAPLGAAARNYLFSLHHEVADAGIYAGTLAVAAGIERSELSALIADVGTDPNAPSFPTVDPDEIAEQYWDMYTRRDGVERIYPRP